MKAVPLFILALALVPGANADVGKGHFVLVGGGRYGADVREEFLRLAGGKAARIVVIPSASNRATPQGTEARWRSYGVKVTVLHAADHRAAINPRLYDCLNRATAVWIGGGKQSRLMAIFRGTPLAAKLRAVLARGGVVAGTSAGASVMSDIMVVGRSESRGLGLLASFIIDQHFDRRHREERLKKLIQKHADKIGYGIDERTALVISGDSVRVVGPGKVTRYRADGTRTVLEAMR
jgi:cyanophycinase